MVLAYTVLTLLAARRAKLAPVRIPDLAPEPRIRRDRLGEEAARKCAEPVIWELKKGGVYDDPDLCMVVADSDGKELFNPPFQSSR